MGRLHALGGGWDLYGLSGGFIKIHRRALVKTFTLADMQGGWFIGDFEPTCFQTSEFEVAAKSYRKADIDARHVHRVATEITLIVSGRARINDVELAAGTIAVLEPGEAASFEALEDTITMVVKIPSIRGDKYLIE